MRQDAEQRVIDFVSGTQSELRQGRVLLILGELRLKLRLLLIEFAIFVKTPEKLFLARSRSCSRCSRSARACLRSRASLSASWLRTRQSTNITAAPATANGKMDIASRPSQESAKLPGSSDMQRTKAATGTFPDCAG